VIFCSFEKKKIIAIQLYFIWNVLKSSASKGCATSYSHYVSSKSNLESAILMTDLPLVTWLHDNIEYVQCFCFFLYGVVHFVCLLCGRCSLQLLFHLCARLGCGLLTIWCHVVFDLLRGMLYYLRDVYFYWLINVTINVYHSVTSRLFCTSLHYRVTVVLRWSFRPLQYTFISHLYVSLRQYCGFWFVSAPMILLIY
jgi:hypothetical protein